MKTIIYRYTAVVCMLICASVVAKANLYLCGASWGWDLSESPEMQRMESIDEEYVWNGWINAGEVKFLKSQDLWTPGLVCADGYQNGITFGKLYNLMPFEGDNSRDYKFNIHDSGYYDVHVNVTKGTVVFSHSLYFIGMSRTTGFAQDQGLRMTPVGDDLFRITVSFNGSDAYFGFANALGGNDWFMGRFGPADGKHITVSDNTTYGLCDHNIEYHDCFVTNVNGAWTITVNLKDKTAHFQRANISAIGHVNHDNGWSTTALAGFKDLGQGISAATVNVTGEGYFMLTHGGGDWQSVNEGRVSPFGDLAINTGVQSWEKPVSDDIVRPAANVTSQLWIHNVDLWTDRAVYAPGQPVYIQFSKYAEYPGAMVRYRHHADVILEHPLTQEWWQWTPPTTDFQGYLVDVYTRNNDTEHIIATIGVDVSSTWQRFPRNGYTAWYEPGKEQYIPGDVAFLNRRHINIVQFQDWHWRHHRPFCNDDVYTDISNRQISKNVVNEFIKTMHGYNMKTLFYNLCYGALEQDGAQSDGVSNEWYLYTDAYRNNKDCHPLLNIGWKSNICLTNPGNSGWQNYMCNRIAEVYDNLPFDGYQVDQLGPRNALYDYWGNYVNIHDGYAPFLQAVKRRFPDKTLIMNAVSDYGGDNITRSGVVDACYTELWGGMDKMKNLYWNVFDNNKRSNNSLKTIFACYMNYDYGRNNPGKEFNAPGVLLTDACMFALGGCHLELGTGGNMLCNEYFPNTNLKIGDKLSDAITHYYDFITAYENLLYDCKLFNDKVERDVEISSPNAKISPWTHRHDLQARHINILAREANDGKKLFHMLNFSDVNSLSWRDINGDMPEPRCIDNIVLHIDSDTRVNRVWAASPDIHGGAPVDVQFTQSGRIVTVTVPLLKYWTMLVFE